MKRVAVILFLCILGAAFAQAGFPRTVTDDEGRELTLERPPERVIAMYNAGYGVVATLGVRPVGQLANPEMISDPRYLPDGESIVDVANAEFNADLEKIAELKPDLVIGGDLELAQSLEGIVPTFIVDYPESLDDVYADLRNTSKVFGLEDHAETLISQFEDRVAAYQASLPAEQPTTLIAGIPTTDELWFGNSGGCEVLNFISICDWDITSDQATGTLETLLSLDPAVLIIGNADPPDGYEALFNELDEKPLWGELSAVKNERVLLAPELTNPAAYSLVGARVMLDTYVPLIYPDIFPEPLTDAQVQEALGK